MEETIINILTIVAIFLLVRLLFKALFYKQIKKSTKKTFIDEYKSVLNDPQYQVKKEY